MSPFEILNKIDCNGHTEEKNGLTYLSWAWAWTKLKQHFPRSFYTIYENKDGLFYHTDGNTCWVKTGVTLVDDVTATSLEHIEFLPVMDHRNKSIPLANVTSFDVNKAIQRSLTKAVARHGLGLYIYAGEDLPESDPIVCENCGDPITETLINGKRYSGEAVAKASQKAYGKPLCYSCKKRIDEQREQGEQSTYPIMAVVPRPSNVNITPPNRGQ